MNKIEYWIIAEALQSPYSFHGHIKEHNFSPEDIASVGITMFQNGDIRVLFQDESYNRVPQTELTIEQLYKCIQKEITASYMITPKGGERWEELVKPNWHYYYSGSLFNPKTYRGYSASINKEILENLIRYHKYLYPTLFSEFRVMREIIWDIVSPWQPRTFYWKTFPEAHRVQYTYVLASEEEKLKEKPDPFSIEFEKAREWHDSIRPWYEHFFEP